MNLIERFRNRKRLSAEVEVNLPGTEYKLVMRRMTPVEFRKWDLEIMRGQGPTAEWADYAGKKMKEKFVSSEPMLSKEDFGELIDFLDIFQLSSLTHVYRDELKNDEATAEKNADTSGAAGAEPSPGDSKLQ